MNGDRGDRKVFPAGEVAFSRGRGLRRAGAAVCLVVAVAVGLWLNRAEQRWGPPAVEPPVTERTAPAPQVLIDVRIVAVDPGQVPSLLSKTDGGSGEALDSLEKRGLARTVASPRLLAVGGTAARFTLGDKVVFSSGVSRPPEEHDVGLVVDVTPRVDSQGFIT
ncbi:MAG: hypothetical protein HY815_04035, partial [Candidatus Riflebacteria bacterium]|nr:hypothetical protein [Candidatus Riflebacteria bacterium]